MTDLRKAAEMALEALEWINRVNAMDYEYQRKAQEPIQALRQALAQPEQEPVAWVGFDKDGDRSIAFEQKTLHEDDYPIASPLYTAPPKREWVGLTRRELDIATLGLEDLSDCYKAIEAKLKEKNT